MLDLRPGQLVCSLAGRDKDEYYLVLKRLDKRHIHLVNGKNKKVSSPKKKNIAHVQRINYVVKDFPNKLADGSIDDGKISYLIKEALRAKEEKRED